MNNGFAIDVCVPFVLIAGGSNFPTRKKEKQNAARNISQPQSVKEIFDKTFSYIIFFDKIARIIKNKVKNIEKNNAL